MFFKKSQIQKILKNAAWTNNKRQKISQISQESTCVGVVLKKYYKPTVWNVFSFAIGENYLKNSFFVKLPRATASRNSHHSCFMKKVFLKISQNSQENTYTVLLRRNHTIFFL